jgi:hypothetical protein
VEPPPEDAGPQRSFKYPFTACEIFCCEVEGIFNTLLENEDLLAQLFSLLEVRWSLPAWRQFSCAMFVCSTVQCLCAMLVCGVCAGVRRVGQGTQQGRREAWKCSAWR